MTTSTTSSLSSLRTSLGKWQTMAQLQSRTSLQRVNSNFVLGSAIWQTRWNMRVVFDSSPLAPICENMTSSIKPKAQRVAMSSEKDRATATGNM